MDEAATAKGHLLLVDGSGFTFRAFHSLPELTRSDGTPVNALLGFVNMLMKLLDDTDADHIAVVFDVARRTFRNDIYTDYKAQRPPPPDDLVPQFALIREAVAALNVAQLGVTGYEADDLIATYARLAHEAGMATTIVSSDKDLMQLIRPGIGMYDPMKEVHIGPEEVYKKFGASPEKVVEIQALAGDSTDNVPGVPGIGVKTASALIAEYGDLDTLLARAGEIKQPKRRANLLEYADLARVSRELVRLRDDAPTPLPLSDLAREEPDPEQLLTFLREQEFKSVVTRLQSKLGVEETALQGDEPVLTSECNVITSVDVLKEWVEEAIRAGAVAIHTQTSSERYLNVELVGVALCVDPSRVGYVSLQGSNGAVALAALAPLLSNTAVLKIGYDVKATVVALARYGLEVQPVDDVLLISFVLEGVTQSGSLEDVAARKLGRALTPYKGVVGAGKSAIAFGEVPVDTAAKYMGERVECIMRLHKLLKPELALQGVTTVYETVERPLIAVLGSMEMKGMKVDGDRLRQVGEELTVDMAGYERECYILAGHKFKLGSPQQVGTVLFEEMGAKGGRKGKSGAYSTDAAMLEKLSANGYEIASHLLSWRQLSKLKSTYTDVLPKQIHPDTGRVHSTFAIAAASTGRLASLDPNLMNIPIRSEAGQKIREAFVPEPGSQLVSLDYSQIELRILSHIADIKTLRQAFAEGQDIHALTAAETFGVGVDEVTIDQRRSAKAINFGIIYGLGAFGLAQQLGIPRREAAAFIRDYFERYPGIQDYMEAAKEECREHGAVRTLFGRRCLIPGIGDKNPGHRAFAERAAINAPIQGTAADLLKRAIARVPVALQKHGLEKRAYFLLTVHDELLFEVEDECVDDLISVIKPLMETVNMPAVPFSVPLVVECGVGRTWAEAH